MFFESNNTGNCKHYYNPKGEQKQKEASKEKEKEHRLCLDKTLNNDHYNIMKSSCINVVNKFVNNFT